MLKYIAYQTAGVDKIHVTSLMSAGIVNELKIINIKHSNGKSDIRICVNLGLQIFLFIFISSAVINICERVSSHNLKKSLVDKIKTKGVTELIEYQSHSALIYLQEMVVDLRHAVSENDITIGFICFVERKEDIEMIDSFSIISGDEIFGIKHLIFKQFSILCRIQNFHLFAVTFGS